MIYTFILAIGYYKNHRDDVFTKAFKFCTCHFKTDDHYEAVTLGFADINNFKTNNQPFRVISL